MNRSTNPLPRFLFGPNAVARIDANSWVLVAGCLALLCWKLQAIWTLNVNWDEFYFLSNVHALLRGDLGVPFQSAYTQIFRWLPWAGDGELAQLHAARLCMWLLLALSVWQIVRLASRWVSAPAALAAAVAFLCVFPVQVHGASFRADSLLLPLLLGVVLLLTRPAVTRRADLVAGLLCGIGMAVSVKMALFAPLFLGCVVLAGEPIRPVVLRLRDAVPRCLLIGAGTLVVAAALIALHHLTLRATDLESTSSFADRSLGKTILETRFLPTEFYVQRLFRADRFVWLLLGIGLVLALIRRRWHLVVMVLAITPVLFYRNAFPYFYVDMLAPVITLVALVVDEVSVIARRNVSASRRDWVPTAFCLLLLVQAGSRLYIVGADQQLSQRIVLDTVHRIFPRPVTYMDHAGMVSTYHKVNFFMSTWGMDEYLRRGKPFVLPALREFRPPLLLVNRSYINVYSSDSNYLMPEDLEALSRFYQPYWGPIFIAGARAELAGVEPQLVKLPYPGKYRLEAKEAVTIDGTPHAPGDVIECEGETVEIARHAGSGSDRLELRLLTAEAGPAPSQAPDFPPLFEPL